jgi:Na+-transporting NADH:ubiquinone oxidoreductase subunit B
MSARDFLDRLEPHFTKGGKLEKYFGLYEMVDTFIYTPADVTRGTTHVRETDDDVCGHRDFLMCADGDV